MPQPEEDEDLLDEIRRAQVDAATRVINGGMRENLFMAQVRAGEDAVIASLERMKIRLQNPAAKMDDDADTPKTQLDTKPEQASE